MLRVALAVIIFTITNYCNADEYHSPRQDTDKYRAKDCLYSDKDKDHTKHDRNDDHPPFTIMLREFKNLAENNGGVNGEKITAAPMNIFKCLYRDLR
jgi:hypothetical protein